MRYAPHQKNPSETRVQDVFVMWRDVSFKKVISMTKLYLEKLKYIDSTIQVLLFHANITVNVNCPEGDTYYDKYKEICCLSLNLTFNI